MTLPEKIEEFIAYRKEIKKPIKEASRKAFLKRLVKLANNNEAVMIEILDQSIANGWQGIFPVKEQNKPIQMTNFENNLNAIQNVISKYGTSE